MNIIVKGQVVYKDDEERSPLKNSDFGQDLTDAVLKAFNEHGFEGLAPFPPGREDVFDKISKTEYLGVFLDDPEGQVYGNFATTFTSNYSWFKDSMQKGDVVLEAQPGGAVRAKSPVLDMYLNVGD